MVTSLHENTRRGLLTRISWIPFLYVAALIVFDGWNLWPALFRSWFFLSDEYVIVAEVIRFLHFDFRQHFFDMPGTPLMILSALLWVLIYLVGIVIGVVPHAGGLDSFTFHHLPLLFTVMRGVTVFFALVSIALVFLLASKVIGKAGAAIAAFIVAMSPAYMAYSSFIRVESLSMCLMLASGLAMLKAIGKSEAEDAAREIRWIFISGFLAGLAAACRFHSFTASVPFLLLLLLLNLGKPGDKAGVYPARLAATWKWILRLGCVASIALAILVKSGYLQRSALGKDLTSAWPDIFRKLYPLLVFAAIVLAAIWILNLIPRTKSLLDRYLHPRVFVLLGSCFVGCLAGTPTILWQYKYFLQSLATYNSPNYMDLDRASWPILKNIIWFVEYYLRRIAPDNLTLALIAVGAILIVVKRDRRLIPFLVVAIGFFVSKPINILAARHHLLLWLPFYAIVAGYCVTTAYEALLRNIQYAGAVKSAAVVALLIALAFTSAIGPRNVPDRVRRTEVRLHNIQNATNWIHANTESNAIVAISYFCFNPDIFYEWMKYFGVAVPDYVRDSRRYLIWWGNRSSLKGTKGYALATHRDVQYLKQNVDLVTPGDGTDPFTDPAFHRIKRFGYAPVEVDLFQFDFTGGVAAR